MKFFALKGGNTQKKHTHTHTQAPFSKSIKNDDDFSYNHLLSERLIRWDLGWAVNREGRKVEVPLPICLAYQNHMPYIIPYIIYILAVFES